VFSKFPTSGQTPIQAASRQNKFLYSNYLFTFAADKAIMISNTHIHHHHLTHGVGCDGIM
jgi:hypothetical protein